MIVAILTLSFLLSLLPLVIGTFCYRYVANFYSRGILGLSAVGCVLGLAQFGLLTGTFYKLFPKEWMKEAALWMQYVNIAGGIVMILAGVLWVGFFRALMKKGRVVERSVVLDPSVSLESAMTGDAVASARKAIREEEVPSKIAAGLAGQDVPVQKVRVSRRRREAPDLTGDFFAEEVPVRRVVKMAAIVGPKEGARSKPRVSKKKALEA